MKLCICRYLLIVLACSGLAMCQVPAASLSQPLAQLDQTSRQAVMDLGNLRIEKWKTDGSVKDQMRNNVESLQKNLTAALPTLMQQVRSNPASVAAVVRLYHNLNVVYDVLATVAESAGAFGPKDDYRTLATDVSNLDTARRNIADQLEQMAAAQDAAYARLQNQVRAQQQAEAAAPPKKVIIDDESPPKKTTTRKKKKSSSSSTAVTPHQ